MFLPLKNYYKYHSLQTDLIKVTLKKVEQNGQEPLRELSID
jgi:hypothetical protein